MLKARDDVAAVVHAHPPRIVAADFADEDMAELPDLGAGLNTGKAWRHEMSRTDGVVASDARPIGKRISVSEPPAPNPSGVEESLQTA